MATTSFAGSKLRPETDTFSPQISSSGSPGLVRTDHFATESSYASLEERVPQDHPLRRIREMVDQILRGMAKDLTYVIKSVEDEGKITLTAAYTGSTDGRVGYALGARWWGSRGK